MTHGRVLVRTGSDLVDWLNTHVEGFADRRDARKYATNLLKAGYIRHTVNKINFSEQCYYVFGDLCGGRSVGRLARKHASLSAISVYVTTNLAFALPLVLLIFCDNIVKILFTYVGTFLCKLYVINLIIANMCAM